jgi:hypothetical protein
MGAKKFRPLWEFCLSPHKRNCDVEWCKCRRKVGHEGRNFYGRNRLNYFFCIFRYLLGRSLYLHGGSEHQRSAPFLAEDACRGAASEKRNSCYQIHTDLGYWEKAKRR